jgi:hypothetical protein
MVSPTKKGESRAAIADGSVAVAVDQEYEASLFYHSNGRLFTRLISSMMQSCRRG